MRRVSNGVGCMEGGHGWCFYTCWLNIPIFVTHIFTTMQTCAIIRMVFINTSKNRFTCAVMKDDWLHLWGDIYESFWESDNAIPHYVHPEELKEIDAEKAKRWPQEYDAECIKTQQELL